MKKDTIENTIALLEEWGCTAWELILRAFWITVFVTMVITLLRAMSWADTGARGGSTPVEKTFIPTIK